jgi:serine protease AprX
MRLTISIFMALSTVGLGQAADQKVSPELQGLAPDASVDVIVKYRQAATPAQHNRIMARGGEFKQSLDIIRAAHYSIPAGQLEALSNDPDVESISPDHLVFATWKPVFSVMYTGSPDFGYKTVGADLAKSVFGMDGTGVGIAMIDSGILDSDDLKDAQGHSRIVYKASLIPGVNQDDHYGHGSHVSGILAGNGSKSAQDNTIYLVRGIAPNAKIISLKALNDAGAGTDSAVIAAIQKAISLKTQYNIRVINLSLGRPVTGSYTTDPLCLAVQQAWQAGIVVVVAAGNNGRDNSLDTNGYGTITAPGNSPYVITVGAMNTSGTPTATDDKIASYSSKGPTSIDHIVKPDLVAPGNRIISLAAGNSLLQKTYPGNAVARSVYSSDNGKTKSVDYYELSGTSMAAPMVAGAAALLIQKNPLLTPDQIKARLMKTATKFAPGFSTVVDPSSGLSFTSEYDIFTIGAGYLNIPAALSNNDTFTGAALSPTATFDATTNTVQLTPSATFAVWGTGTLSANMAVWGSSVFNGATFAVWGTGAVWGTMAVWGTSTPQAVMAVWGTFAVWGTNAPGGEASAVAINGDN